MNALQHLSPAHTKGPWDDASGYPWIDSVRIFAKTHYIATVGNSDDPREVTEANARLIAAAPDLLDACQLAEDYMRQMTNAPLGTRLELRKNALAYLRAAIAKAEGR